MPARAPGWSRDRCGRSPARARRPRPLFAKNAVSLSRKFGLGGGPPARAPRPRPGFTCCAWMSIELLIRVAAAERGHQPFARRRSGCSARPCPTACRSTAAKSASRSMAVTTTSAFTGPSVPGVHARGAAISGNGCGAITSAASPLVSPAAAERPPRFLADVRHAPVAQPPFGPRRRGTNARGVGEARAVDVGEVPERVHHLRALQALFFDPGHRVELGRIGPWRLGNALDRIGLLLVARLRGWQRQRRRAVPGSKPPRCRSYESPRLVAASISRSLD